MNINRLTKQVVAFIAGFITFLCLLGLAGSAERVEQIVYTMPQEAYEAVYLKLGDGCSQREIADEYMSDKQYYDALSN